MSPPFATVILPTLNRHATLPFAITSVLRQTERSIQILIVLDGANAACRKIAEEAAKADQRIRVLDLPKAPASGERNVDLAVSEAAAERIFYIDDDDLFLPLHIAKLGVLLDTADVADSRLCSADRSGRLNLGVARGSNPAIRRLLGDFHLKMLYDTHFAHRKDAYGRFSTWVPPSGEGTRPVWEFFARFANNPACRWASLDEVTAISLHGAARRDMTPEERAREIASWEKCVGNPAAIGDALADASTTFNLFRLLNSERPHAGSLVEYRRDRGGYADVGSCSTDSALFGLFRGVLPSDEEALELAMNLSEPVESGYLFEIVAMLFCDAYGVEEAGRLLRKASILEGNNLASRVAAYSAVLSRTDRAAALQLAERACSLGPDPLRSLARWRASLQG